MQGYIEGKPNYSSAHGKQDGASLKSVQLCICKSQQL